jgi:endonuclease/exonuclease/phosphatase family metal-dependent hydrolase
MHFEQLIRQYRFWGTLLSVVLLIGCGDFDSSTSSPSAQTASSESTPVGKADTFDKQDLLDLPERDGTCNPENRDRDPDCFIRVASWNIQNFSTTKGDSPDVMNRVADVIRHFDVIAIQEVSNIREKDDDDCERNAVCPNHESCRAIEAALEKHLNEDHNRNYGFKFSKQIRQERYLFVYNRNRVELLESRLMNDPEETGPVCSMSKEKTGQLLRQPQLGIFKSKNFSFGILNNHMAPLSAHEELQILPEYIQRARDTGVSDVIAVGDINADCNYLSTEKRSELKLYTRYLWLFPKVDTTVSGQKCNYDQIIIGEPTLEDITGDLGIYTDVSAETSDHYPIWANFYVENDTDSHNLN